MPTPRPGRPDLVPQAQTGSLWPPLLVVLALVVVAGCAQPGTQTLATDPATTSTTPPTTVTVGPNDDGRTVNLKVGDRLIVQLQTTKRPSKSPPAWMLRPPPSKVLKRVQGKPDSTQVVFVADGAGTVRLTLVKRLGCYPPLRCPLAAQALGQSEQRHPPLPTAMAIIAVRVR